MVGQIATELLPPRRRREHVAIVGAGPTGVMLAIELARRGVDVRVFDKQPSPSQETRAIGIHARTLESFHRIGIVEEFLELGHRVDGAVVHSPARLCTRVGFGGLESPYPYLLTLGQHETQRILDQELERLGVTIERGVAVADVRDRGDEVELSLERAGEERERTWGADWVVGCDGAHSIVRRRLGMPFDGSDYGQDWLMTEVLLGRPLEGDRFHLFAFTRAPLVAFPLPSGRWRLFLPQVPNRAGERPAPTIEEIERVAAERAPVGLELTDPTLLAAFRCYRRSTPTLRRGRVLLAGDAAHVHTPAGGQGMNTGLQDAFNLGWKLGLVAHGQSPPELLDTYTAERAPIAAGVLRLTHGLTSTFTLASARKRWLRDRLLPPVMAIPAVKRRYTARVAQLSHSYRGGPLALATPGSGRHGSPAAGDRLPAVPGIRLCGKTVSTLDLLTGSSHTLLVLTGARADDRRARDAAEPLSRFARMVRVVTIRAVAADAADAVDPGLRAHRRYGALDGQLLLVRPDGHVACRAPLDRIGIPVRYLEELTLDQAGSTCPSAANASGSSARPASRPMTVSTSSGLSADR
jgi:2-polyprenyl-6-methoxyphenol hydroxylase-like FAD-dependent oxidoreductase